MERSASLPLASAKRSDSSCSTLACQVVVELLESAILAIAVDDLDPLPWEHVGQELLIWKMVLPPCYILRVHAPPSGEVQPPSMQSMTCTWPE